jgi:diamine N-acetyltransferase
MLENHPGPRTSLFYAVPTSLAVAANKLARLQDDPNTILFTICSKEPDEPVGQVALLRVDWVGRMGVYYLGISDPENWSKGYGGETTQLIVDYAFTTLNMNRLHLHVECDNEKAVKAYRRAGYVTEGTLREAMYADGRYHDFYVMGIIRSDWEKMKK